MNKHLLITLFALLAFAQSLFILPAAAGTPAPAQAAAVVQESLAPLTACPPQAKGANLAQVTSTECCKDQKGICGCRAGKIVCCDSKPSTHPGCACHGDEGFIE